MGAGHSHGSHRRAEPAPVGAGPRRVLLALLGLVAVATVVGLVALWPDSSALDDVGSRADFAGPGVTFPTAEVTSLDGRALEATVLEGTDQGDTVALELPPQVAESGLTTGDTVLLRRIPGGGDVPTSWSWFGTERTDALLWLAVAFVVVVLLVAWHRGLFAMAGLAISAVLILGFLLPGLLTGGPALLLGLVCSSAILYVVLYTTHGFSIRTSAALAGTLVGIAITAALGVVTVQATRLSGVGEGGGLLQTYAVDLDFQGLLTCAVMIAGLGVLNDVTITQTSAVWEIRAASPTMSRRRLLASGMRIGRDHIASTIYTIAFAYTGTALTLLLVLRLYELPLLELLSTEEITAEVVRTLVTSIGLVLAVPVTTAIAVALTPPRRSDA
ncbi:hypothetical protein GCM10009623_19960 [Nocardioides aestuarii]|uniref:YibE/F family protein n=1 Tax=Nocardioides aestuarii TaxID=252231 RepID=A0ABW4TMM4_9ACTN